MDPVIGDRVVVRYRLGPATVGTPSLSDVTGVLTQHDDRALIVDGKTIPLDAVTSIKQLSRHVVRNSDIRKVQARLHDAVAAAQRAEIDGWTLTASPGTDDVRANAAIPTRFGANTSALPSIADWYSGHGANGHLIVPERLQRETGVSGGTEWEVLIDSAGSVRAIAGDDVTGRTSLRQQGFELHHVYRLVALSPTVYSDV